MYSLFLDSTKVIFEQSLSVSLVRRPSTELFALVLRSSPSNKESRQASSIFMIRRPCFAIFCVFLKEWNRTFLFSKWEICQIIGSLVHWIPFFFLEHKYKSWSLHTRYLRSNHTFFIDVFVLKSIDIARNSDTELFSINGNRRFSGNVAAK